MIARYLLDTSAVVRLLRDRSVGRSWERLLASGLLAVCPVVELELLYTARSKAHRDELSELLRTAFTWVPMPDTAFDRAAQVQAALTERGTHRSAGVADLLVSAAAELQGLTLVHYDRDFVQVADATNQPVTWIAPPGTVD